jgi:hypothetical protein
MSYGGVLCKAVILALIGSSIASCSGSAPQAHPEPTPAITSPVPIATMSPTPPVVESPQPASSTSSDSYEFPTEIDPTKKYMFYLHGKILEDQGLPAISPVYGEYRYEEILKVLESYGFVIVSEQRPKNADGWQYAQRGARQIAELISSNVPPGHITVVGASKGATIATGISNLVGISEVNYVLLGTCHPSLIDEWKQQGVTLFGNVLAIYDVADDEYSGSCEDLFARSEGKGLGQHLEIVLHVGTGHGILYEPLEEWVVPTVRWANQEW